MNPPRIYVSGDLTESYEDLRIVTDTLEQAGWIVESPGLSGCGHDRTASGDVWSLLNSADALLVIVGARQGRVLHPLGVSARTLEVRTASLLRMRFAVLAQETARPASCPVESSLLRRLMQVARASVGRYTDARELRAACAHLVDQGLEKVTFPIPQLEILLAFQVGFERRVSPLVGQLRDYDFPVTLSHRPIEQDQDVESLCRVAIENQRILLMGVTSGSDLAVGIEGVLERMGVEHGRCRASSLTAIVFHEDHRLDPAMAVKVLVHSHGVTRHMSKVGSWESAIVSSAIDATQPTH